MTDEMMDCLLVPDFDQAFYKELYISALEKLPSDILLTAIAAQRIRHIFLTESEREAAWTNLKEHLNHWREEGQNKLPDVICPCSKSYYISGLGSAPYLGGTKALKWFEQLPDKNEEEYAAFFDQNSLSRLKEPESWDYFDWLDSNARYMDCLRGFLFGLFALLPKAGLCGRPYINKWIIVAFNRGNGLEDSEATMVGRMMAKKYGQIFYDDLERMQDRFDPGNYQRFLNIVRKLP